ncbi:ABC transporter substrate-binding protein [Janthinobacterium sp.]|uniref:ABC transporter substrate-binding protein n=1 Tax=Janthinobacterium sp. TaxID=1871054 RepID=UPI00293D5977|nr:ABC transporter substrate-binding protein [Janthinobacterium sp.]
MHKKIGAAVVAAGAMMLALGAQAKDLGEIRWGTDPSNAPFESKGKSGKLQGFDIELGEAICVQLKARCTWVENDFDGMIPALKAKKFDAINSSMSATDKRLKEIDFSSRVTRVPGRMIARVGANLTPTPEGLKGKRVGVQQGTTHETYVKEKWAAAGVEVVSYIRNDMVYADLQAGRIDAGVLDSVAANEEFLKQPIGQGFAFAGPAIQDEKIFGKGTGFGVRRDNVDLKNALNKALAELKANGTFKKIMARHFELDVSGD